MTTEEAEKKKEEAQRRIMWKLRIADRICWWLYFFQTFGVFPPGWELCPIHNDKLHAKWFAE